MPHTKITVAVSEQLLEDARQCARKCGLTFYLQQPRILEQRSLLHLTLGVTFTVFRGEP